MNRYHDAMERCAPPPDLEARLRERVLAAKPEPAARHAVYRPRGFFRRAALAAVLAGVLTVSAGAAVVANWDAILTSRFGAWAASTPMGQAAFQEVYVTSVCDDVTLTVRQALVSEQTVCLVLDYRLPDTADRELLRRLQEDGTPDATLFSPKFAYYLTGDISWEDLKAADGAAWESIDWADYLSYADYVDKSHNALRDFRLSRYTGGTSSSTTSQGYDPDTHTLTCLCEVTVEPGDVDFTAQPLTVLASPPILEVNGTETALADHPAILTFQPEAVGQTLTGAVEEDGASIWASVSPFAISVEVTGGTPYREVRELRADTALVYRDGTVQPVGELTSGLGGGGSRDGEDGLFLSVSFTSSFRDLLDVSQVEALQVGDATVPLERS